LFGLNIPSKAWQKDIESAESYWLSSAALQCCASAYLTDRLGKDQEYLLGDKAPKTLRLSQEARSRLLDDFRKLPRSTEPVARDWEKWLKGTHPTVSVTFEQVEAAENSKAMHLSITHPLVRQAALHLKLDDQAFVALQVKSSEVQSGEYRFGVYRWTKQGVKHDELLAAIASDIDVEGKLFSLLQTATTLEHATLPDNSAFDELDTKHHAKWTSAQANHIAENREQVDFRIQSLTVSHRARCKAIEDQLLRATNERIRLMKQSELARANADFDRRMQSLEQAAGSGDIHASPVIFGTLVVKG
jgi:ATP-dependent helicase HepA